MGRGTLWAAPAPVAGWPPLQQNTTNSHPETLCTELVLPLSA